ncbi:hypothetical protein [Streptomyces shenzhenensis]|uniref:hypothetical protein n=1 Tax=Streptomyces shenzhenensis TaxID=943815 RepID=UPI001F2E6EAE|nr:hypothetical protein [Streptomyces shenzhenensis]
MAGKPVFASWAIAAKKVRPWPDGPGHRCEGEEWSCRRAGEPAGRRAGLISGLVLAALVATAGPLAARIPLPVIGALVAVIGCKLIAARAQDIRRILNSGRVPTAVLLVTFLAATQTPLDQALLVALAASLLARLAAPIRSRVRNTVGAFSRP